MPQEVQDLLFDGMNRVVIGPKGTARPNVIRALFQSPTTMQNYTDLQQQMIGKTGTAEILYKQWIDAQSKAEINNHIWFGCISFSPETKGATSFGDPEIVVVVYLRFSDAGGKEAAPLAAQMIHKWREIIQKQGNSSYLSTLKQASLEQEAAAQNTQW